jgi:hypothetical protein
MACAGKQGRMTDRFGPRPEYADLPVADLAVDSSYQRSIELRRNQAAIERICEGFRWSLFGIVTVTKGLTGYLIIDGQHRTEAARRLKIATVPCLIVPPISRKDQALAFVAANRDRVPVSQFAIHHALVAAGDEHAAALDRLCTAAGIEIPRYPIPSSSMKPGQTLAIGAVSVILDSRGPERAAVLLKAIRQAFPNERAALRAPIITAVSTLDTVDDIDADALQRALAKAGLKAFEKECALLMIDSGNSKGRTQAAIAVIERLMGLKRPQNAVEEITPSASKINAVAEKPAPERIISSPRPVNSAGLPLAPKAAPKPVRQPIPVSDGRAKPKVGPSREELDRAISSFVATKGVTQCPPAAVAPTEARPGSKFTHEVLTPAQQRAREAGEAGNRRQGKA